MLETLSMFVFFFFFQSSSPTRHLHSFPTRRSSDLTSSSTTARWRHGCCRISKTVPSSSRAIPTRSEEHTSELQSHHDLVCRLLLEKKKYNLGLFLPG